jgi:hypothetical protein
MQGVRGVPVSRGKHKWLMPLDYVNNNLIWHGMMHVYICVELLISYCAKEVTKYEHISILVKILWNLRS